MHYTVIMINCLSSEMLVKFSRFACALLLFIVLALVNTLNAQPQIQGYANMQTVKGKFEVVMQPQTDEGFDVGRMTLDKTYHGELNATAKGQMLSHVTDVKGSAGYVAIEHVNGMLNGKTGAFVLQHSGEMSSGNQTLSITIIPDSGTGELIGISGGMEIDIIDGQHFYILHYEF